MSLDPVALATLSAVVQERTFERAAVRLRVTPSAVSQRIKALERSVGQVVVSRTKPVTPTPAGEVLVRLAGHWDLLVHDALVELVPDRDTAAHPQVPVVVNADSLATWILPPLALAQEELGIALDVVREDEEHASDLVRSGAALAAVTADPTPVAGCRITPLGSLRYLAVCTPAFRDRWLPRGVRAADLDRAPMVRFDRKDTMQHRVARRWVRRDITPPSTFIGSSQEFAEAVRLGMGWALMPAAWAEEGIRAGQLVPVGPRPRHDVPLHWLAWRLPSRTLDVLTRHVTAGAAAALVRRGPGQTPGGGTIGES
ncbi:LysR family transcriptional regulator ArgP [Ornithinimicrobium cerasi]|uniref:LysR family transcriptional regulator, chromosome initiation inhibitor n=1 Tax=Ornithinimicrobium cerasi TaxID=2248773 RepID=A0A285VLK4_9MICO|nr:LysR family transcriptional regulator ArgP [Ornithinimicrobium cerasi]SOC54955.1 LysR family transcriptional regulator, chromosome initiation inhibitor [Ornithinimicrobium cerasi]